MRGDFLSILQKIKRFIIYIETNIHGECTIPYEELEMIVKCLLPDITKFFEKEENKQRYEQWKSKNTESSHLTKPTV